MRTSISTLIVFCLFHYTEAQMPTIPIDTLNWDIQANSYVLETFKGQQSIYLQGGSMRLKNKSFLNGTIEYDIYLKDAQAFPGVYFRSNGSNAEQFYIRPHQSGNPDANQALPQVNGISAWQLYFGRKYSFPYEYHYNDWTHVKLVVNNDKAQVYLNHSDQPQNSWYLFHEPQEGSVSLTGGNAQGLHLANIKIDTENFELHDFKPGTRAPIEGLIPSWSVSDKFEETLLNDPSKMASLVKDRKWKHRIQVEEGTAANISKAVELGSEIPGNTVFAKIKINASTEGNKLFEFGYSDRVVVVLNGKPIYRGSNRFRSRDYRYLGTVGLFDAVYLDLKKGNNTLLLAVSEDFGGWLVTGRITNMKGLTVK